MSKYLNLVRQHGGVVRDCEISEISPRCKGLNSGLSREKSEISEKRPACERCGDPLRLPESVQLGVCCHCMTEGEWIDTLARMALRREATKRAVERRKSILRRQQTVWRPT